MGETTNQRTVGFHEAAPRNPPSPEPPSTADYLKKDLDDRVKMDRAVLDFIQAESLDGIWYRDLEQPEYQWVSPSFWRLLGHDPAEKQDLASEWQAVLAPDDLRTFEAHCRDARHQNDGLHDQIIRYRHKDGSSVWLRCQRMVIRDQAGKAIRLLGTHVDVTELMETSARLQIANSALARSNADLEQFAFAASHDLQEPIRMMSLYAQLLEKKCKERLDESSLQYVEYIVSGAARLHQLVNALLMFSKAGSADVALVRFSLQDALNEALENLQGELGQYDARIETAPLPKVFANRDAMGRVFQNLLDNALKFRSAVPLQIRIDAQEQDSDWVIGVHDNGIGIAPDHHERIFGLFKRLNKREEYPGNGVGLALVQRLIHQQGGRTWVESGEGQGAHFFFTLPRADRPVLTESPQQVPPSR